MFGLTLPEMTGHSGLYKFRGGGVGVGLGLTAARMIMERHGGSLTIKSAGENAGAVVSLRFPLAS